MMRLGLAAFAFAAVLTVLFLVPEMPQVLTFVHKAASTDRECSDSRVRLALLNAPPAQARTESVRVGITGVTGYYLDPPDGRPRRLPDHIKYWMRYWWLRLLVSDEELAGAQCYLGLQSYLPVQGTNLPAMAREVGILDATVLNDEELTALAQTFHRYLRGPSRIKGRVREIYEAQLAAP